MKLDKYTKRIIHRLVFDIDGETDRYYENSRDHLSCLSIDASIGQEVRVNWAVLRQVLLEIVE